MTLSTQLYGWSQVYAQRGLDFTQHYDEILTAVAEAGYDSAEGSLDLTQPDFVPAWAERLRAHGLRPASLYAGGDFHVPDLAETVVAGLLAVAPALSASGFSTLCVNPNPIGRPKTDAELAIQAAQLQVLGAGLRAHGVALGLHNHTPEMINAGREFHGNLRNTDPQDVGLFMDVHWCYRGGADPCVIWDEYRDRIVGLHVRQSVDGIWVEDLRDGEIDYRPMLTELAARDFTGPIVVEIAYEDGTLQTRDVAEAHRISLEYLRGLL